MSNKTLSQYGWLRPLATLIFVVVLASIFSPRTGEGIPLFWLPRNLANVMRQISEIGILATGMTLVIICGGIDLSVGSLLALSSTVFAITFVNQEWALWLAIPAAMVAATGFGLASGLTIAKLRLQPFIATLAAMVGSRGFARWLADNETIAMGYGQEYTARVASWIAQKTVVVSAFLTVAVVGFILLNLTRFGRYLVAIGGSEDTARLSGLNVAWTKIRVYSLVGFLSGVAGIIHCCQNRQGNPNDGVGYELDAIAAVVIGGTSLAGGKGSIIGTIAGVLALGILSNLLGLRNVDENVQWMLKAVIIVLAVWLQQVGTKRTAS